MYDNSFHNAGAPLGVGLIGLGSINRAHIAGYRSVPQAATIVAVCDTVAAAAEDRARELGATPYTDHHALLADERVDSVDVTLPHSLHFPVVRDALEAGKHVYVEKPLALEPAQCRELIDLARDRGLRFTVAENTRFVAAYLATKRLLDDGSLGRIRTVRTLIYGSEAERIRANRWIGRPEEAGGGVIIDAGVHSFYLLEWLFGRVRRVRATMAAVLPESQVEDNAVVSGELEGGTLFTCELTCTAELPWGERLEVCGEAGVVIVDQLVEPVVRHFRGEHDFTPVAVAGVPYDPEGWKTTSIAEGAADFVHAVREGRPTGVDPEDGYRAVLIAQKAYESVAAGERAVDVSESWDESHASLSEGGGG
jgi:predicted dehydrogenase